MQTLVFRSSVYGISFSKALLQAVCATVVLVAAFSVAYHLFPLIVLLSKALLIAAAFYGLAHVAKLLPTSNPYGGLIVTNATPTIAQPVALSTKEVTALNKLVRAQYGKTAKVEAAIKKVRSLRSSGQSFTATQYVALLETMVSN